MPAKVVPWEIIGDRLQELAKQGLANHEIAMALSREFNAPVTRNAVIGRLRRTNIAKRKAGTVHQRHEVRLAQSKPVKPVSIMQLEQHHCRWPIEIKGETLYCGKLKINGSYCDEHAQRSYQHGQGHGRSRSLTRSLGYRSVNNAQGNQGKSQDPQDHGRIQTGDPSQRLKEGPESNQA